MGMVINFVRSSTRYGSRKSFHTHMISSTPTEMNVGFIMGSTTRKKVRTGPQPSMTAASSISRGMDFTKPENMNTAKPAPKPR